MNNILIGALYDFTPVEDRDALRAFALARGRESNIRGTLLIADEGINGTMAGKEDALRAFFRDLQKQRGLDELVIKFSWSETMPFYRFKVRLKKEIVSFGIADANPNIRVGTYVEPKDWNAVISRDDVILIDTRNDYEYKAGRFKGAIDPATQTFTQFPAYVDDNLNKGQKVAMYCTGGIRCEKATSYLLAQGFDEVFHLKGGILQYLEDVPKAESMWEDECFVFDHRVTVDHDLKPGRYEMCHLCGWPVDDDDKASEFYEHGVSCPACFHARTDEQKARARERQHQIDLAHARGQEHIGPKAA